MNKLLLLILLLPITLLGQSKKQKKALAALQKENQLIISNIKNHCKALEIFLQNDYIAKDSVAQYISNQFRYAGLLPKDTSGYIQTSEIDEGKQTDTATFLKVNGKMLVLNTDYIPLPFSANKKISGMPAMALREKNLPWFADMKDLLSEKNMAGANQYNTIAKEAERAASKGATALLVYNTAANNNVLFKAKDSSTIATIPVIFITTQGLHKYFPDHSDIYDIEGNILLTQKKYSLTNVTGIVDNKADKTVLISTYFAATINVAPETQWIVETAMLIEMAKMTAASKSKSNNYRFTVLDNSVNFSNVKPDDSAINYSVHINRLWLSDNNNELHITGSQTSVTWNEVLKSIVEKSIDIRIDSSNNLTAKSSKANCPFLFFSTIFKPNEEPNFDLQLAALKYIVKIIDSTDSRGKLEFVNDTIKANKIVANIDTFVKKIVKISSLNPHKSSVSLGIVRDDKYNGDGMKIKALTPNKIGEKIRLQPGDIIVQLGDHKVANHSTYLEALSHFEKGDSTVLKIKRGNEDKDFSVIF